MDDGSLEPEPDEEDEDEGELPADVREPAVAFASTRRDGPVSPVRNAFPKLALGALALTGLYGALLWLLAADGRGGLVRLVTQSPLGSGQWLLGGYSAALALTVLLGWLALARRAPTSLTILPGMLVLGAGGVFAALAAQKGAAAVLDAGAAGRNHLIRLTVSRCAFPQTIALLGASMLVGLSALIGVARLYRGELPRTRRWGPIVATVLAALLGASLPLSYSGMSVAVSPLSLLPLVATHYMALLVLAAALPRALRLRGAETAADSVRMVRALGLACLASPLAVLLAWRASSAAVDSAWNAEAGRPLAEALVLLGPQAFAVTLAAAALVALSAGNTLRSGFTPRVAPIAAAVIGVAAIGAYVWAAIATSGIRPPPAD